jgi:hypothetical protein
MKATIEVESRREADMIRTGLDDPAIRAFVIVAGALLPLSPRSRERVLTFVKDQLDEQQSANTK